MQSMNEAPEDQGPNDSTLQQEAVSAEQKDRADTEKPKKDKWDLFSIIASAFGSVGVPLVIAIGSLYAASVVSEREQAREASEAFVLAVNVLQKPPETTSHLIRDWAVDVFQQYSPVEVSPTLREEIEKLGLPGRSCKIECDPPKFACCNFLPNQLSCRCVAGGTETIECHAGGPGATSCSLAM